MRFMSSWLQWAALPNGLLEIARPRGEAEGEQGLPRPGSAPTTDAEPDGVANLL